MDTKIKIKFIKSKNSKLTDLNSNKIFLCNPSIKISSIQFKLRNMLHLAQDQALFININNKIPQQDNTIGDLYYMYKSKDECLHIIYFEEHTFGG